MCIYWGTPKPNNRIGAVHIWPIEGQTFAEQKSLRPQASHGLPSHAPRHSHENIACIQNWLNQCLQDHHECHHAQAAICPETNRPTSILELSRKPRQLDVHPSSSKRQLSYAQSDMEHCRAILSHNFLATAVPSQHTARRNPTSVQVSDQNHKVVGI